MTLTRWYPTPDGVTQAELDLKANIASPTLTGTPAAPTAAPGTNTTQIATTAFVTAAASGEANTADNVGVSGVGTYDSKSGVVLHMRKVDAASSKVTTALNGQKIDIDVVPANFTGIPQSGVTDLPTALAANRYSSWIWPPSFTTAAAGTKSYGDGVGGAVYFGRLPVALSSASIKVRYRITTPLIFGTGGTPWAEIAIATGSVVGGGNMTLTSQFYVDASTNMTAAAGIKEDTITGVTLAAGVDIWLIFSWKLGTSGGTGAIYRGVTYADDLTVGVGGTRTTYRPSTEIGNPLEFTLHAFNVAPMHCVLGLP